MYILMLGLTFSMLEIMFSIGISVIYYYLLLLHIPSSYPIPTSLFVGKLRAKLEGGVKWGSSLESLHNC